MVQRKQTRPKLNEDIPCVGYTLHARKIPNSLVNRCARNCNQIRATLESSSTIVSHSNPTPHTNRKTGQIALRSCVQVLTRSTQINDPPLNSTNLYYTYRSSNDVHVFGLVRLGKSKDNNRKGIAKRHEELTSSALRCARPQIYSKRCTTISAEALVNAEQINHSSTLI